MANVIKDQFAFLDTFIADVTIVPGKQRAKILSISLLSAAAAEYAVFKNGDGERVALCGGVASNVSHFTPCEPITVFGLVFDYAASTLEGGDQIILHLA